MTVEETWVHYYEPQNKAQSRQWVGPWSSRPKKFQFQTQPSDGMVMAAVFWDAKGVIYYVGLFTQEIVVVVVFYVQGKHLRSCRDGQLT